MTEVGTAIVGKIGVEIYKAASPSAFAWLRRFFFGKTVLFVGPSYSGKTSYVTYLQSGELTDPSEFQERTLDHHNSGSLEIKSTNGNVKIDVGRVIDTEGQASPKEHASLIAEHKPHAICLMFDGSEDWAPVGERNPQRSNKMWLENFLISFCQLHQQNTAITTRLKSFCIFMNKCDLIKDESQINVRTEQIKSLVSQHLKGSLGDVALKANVKWLSVARDHPEKFSPEKASLSLFMPFMRGS